MTRKNSSTESPKVQQALRRFFCTVDDALSAAETARAAREDLERLIGRQLIHARESLETSSEPRPEEGEP
jgi:hypothetical protein